MPRGEPTRAKNSSQVELTLPNSDEEAYVTASVSLTLPELLLCMKTPFKIMVDTFFKKV
jgi:hypothetical protein